jgi:hypothetical protein
MKSLFHFVAVAATGTVLLLSSCKKNDYPAGEKQLTVQLNANQEIPSNGRSATGAAVLKISGNKKIKMLVTVQGISAEESITKLHIHAADPVNNGPVVLDFEIKHAHGGAAEGEVDNVRASLIDSLIKGQAELYINVHSSGSPGGFVRGQINRTITNAFTIALSGNNEVPAVNTVATGLSVLRITSDNKLFSKITITNLESGDALKFSHIHKGATGTNGPVLTNLAETAADFGATKIFSPDATVLQSIKTDAIYVNVHSNSSPAGKLRGQIR